MTSPAPRRRWFRFSLRTMFVLVTLAGCVLGWQVRIVHQRQELVQRLVSRGGTAIASSSEPDLPIWRLLLGDEEVLFVDLSSGATKAEIDEAKRTFPEAEVRVDAELPIDISIP